MSDITLTGGIRSNLLSLQNTSSLIEDTQFKLSTGKKVNSALDNAVSFFKAQSLNFRASDLSARKDGIQQGMNVLDAADKGITAILDLVEQAEAKATQATELSPEFTAQQSAAAGTFTDSSTLLTAALTAGDSVDVKVIVGTTTATVTLTTGDSGYTIADFVAEVNSGLGSGIFSFEDNTFVSDSTADLQINVGTEPKLTAFFGGFHMTAAAAAEMDADTASTLSGLAVDYQEILSQIDSLANDASFQGTNLINDGNASNVMSVKFNEDGSNKLDVQGKDLTTSGDLALSTTNLDSIANAEAAQTAIDNATTELRDAASSFGTKNAILDTRQDFTNNMVNALEKGSGDLVNADMNEESANMLSLQTRQQLGTISLSIANQAEQSVLRLF